MLRKAIPARDKLAARAREATWDWCPLWRLGDERLPHLLIMVMIHKRLMNTSLQPVHGKKRLWV